MIIPTKVNIHPFPDLTEYNPEDYYDFSKIVNPSSLDSNKCNILYFTINFILINFPKIKFKLSKSLQLERLY